MGLRKRICRLPAFIHNTNDKDMYHTEEEELYYSKYKGHFSKKLAEWAISHMARKNPATKATEPIKKHSIGEYDEFVQENKLKIPDSSYYDGYYLWHMAAADYPKSLEDDEHVAAFITETICDPDCDPRAVLACFVAKMDVMGIPVYWERFV